MMRKLALMGVVSVALLSGCSGGSYSRLSGGTWDNYKCTAVNTYSGSSFIGWATSEDRARSNALGKCREHNSSDACGVASCHHD